MAVIFIRIFVRERRISGFYVSDEVSHVCAHFLCEENIFSRELKLIEFNLIIIRHKGLDSVVGIATGYGLDDQGVGVRVKVASRIFSSARRPGRLWGPPTLLSNGYRGLLPLG
jgi:hypothetical protein